MMKQILLITDGCSNVGMNPAAAAAHAYSEGIVVNVIGVVDGGDLGEQGTKEIYEIAEAGGGMSRIVTAEQLAQTVQMMTRKTITHTLHQVVQKELRHIIQETDGNSEERYPTNQLDQLPPAKRAEIVRVMDDLGETTPLRVALLVDASASMHPKLQAVQEAIEDLMLSLHAREGKSELAIFHFPGKSEPASRDIDWTTDLGRTRGWFQKLLMQGTTPTGPAIMQAVSYFEQNSANHEILPAAKGRRSG